MTSSAPLQHHYSYDEYLAYERDSSLKHEFEDGRILAMAGGSRRHNALASRVSAALEIARKPECVAFQSDQRVLRVSQSAPRIERYRRLPSGGWEYSDVTEGTVELHGGARLDLVRLYSELPD